MNRHRKRFWVWTIFTASLLLALGRPSYPNQGAETASLHPADSSTCSSSVVNRSGESVGQNADGRLEVFVRGIDDALWHKSQRAPGGPDWSDWTSLGGILTSRPVAAQNSDGRLEVFVQGNDCAVWHISETAPSAATWNTWTSLGGALTGDVAVAPNADGRLEVFVRGIDDALWHKSQLVGGGPVWSNWTSLGGIITSNPVAGRNADGRLEVFVRGSDFALWHISQSTPSAAAWNAWNSLGGVLAGDVAVAPNADGRLEVLVRGIDNALWHKSQLAPGGPDWSGWTLLGGILTSDPVVAQDSDGRLKVFVKGSDFALWHISETGPSAATWNPWTSLDGVLTGDVTVASDADDRLVVFVQGTDNALWYQSQQVAGGPAWSDWASLGGFPEGVSAAVSVVMTTDDQTKLMAAQPGISFSTSSGGSNPVFVDENQAYQQVEGFGASLTDSAAYLLNEVAPASARNTAMSDLFTHNGNGIGLSFMRNPMGASDLARSHYSYDDNNGQPDPSLANFSIAHDRADIIPLVLQAKRLNPQLKIMATPWSPPGWMKDSGSMIGGSLLPGMYAPFANYFVKYIQAYAAAGIPIDYVSLQNEPLYVPADYPGMCMPAAPGRMCNGRTWPTDQTTALRDYILPAFRAKKITARVLVYDHNWDVPDYPDTVLSDSTIRASSQVAGIAWHGYAGTPGVMLTLHNKYPSKSNYQTEHSGGTWVSDQVKSDFEEITQVMRNWGKAYVKWSLALDENRGPHTGGCGTCAPIVNVNGASGAISYPIEFYTLGHFSKFVLPGATRVYSSNANGIVSAAFVNPDISKALVVYNDSNVNQTFQVQWGTQSFTYTLPALAGATFTWRGTQSGGYTVDAKSQIQASSFSSASGPQTTSLQTWGLQTETTSDTNGGYNVGHSDNGDHAVYRNVDFGAGVSGVSVRLASAGSGGTLEFHLDSASGTLVSSVTIPVTGGWQTWQTVSGNASGASGVHDLYVVFKGTTNIGNLNWFQFR